MSRVTTADIGWVKAALSHNPGWSHLFQRRSQSHASIERWVFVGEPDSAFRIRAASRDGTIEIAEVLSAHRATAADAAAAAKRVSLLGLIQGSRADRVVLMPEAVLNRDSPALLWTLRSLGAKISLVADGVPLSSEYRPRPRWIGGLELFDVGGRTDASGAGSPTDGEPRVSAVITTLNEADSLPRLREHGLARRDRRLDRDPPPGRLAQHRGRVVDQRVDSEAPARRARVGGAGLVGGPHLERVGAVGEAGVGLGRRA